MDRRAMATLVVGLAALLADAARAQNEAAESQKLAARLVARLGHEQFAIREQATAQLIALGMSASQALEAGTASADREVRYRSRLALGIIRDLDFQQRLSDFAADPDTDSDYGLPGWQRFRAAAGDGASVKPLFVAMYRAEPELMRVADDQAKVIGQTLDQRCLELRQGVQLLGIQHATESVAALLFLVGNDDVALSDGTNSTLYFFCQQPDFYTAAQIGPSRAALRRMLARWLLREQNQPPRDAMMLAMQYEIAAVLVRARQTVRDPAAKAYDRQYAILAIAKFGGAAEIPLLEELLDEDEVCTEFQRHNERVTVQIRDVALAALLHLAEQDFTEFGFPQPPYRSPYVFSISKLGFAAEDERAAAIAHWRAYRRQQPKTPPENPDPEDQ